MDYEFEVNRYLRFAAFFYLWPVFVLCAALATSSTDIAQFHVSEEHCIYIESFQSDSTRLTVKLPVYYVACM